MVHCALALLKVLRTHLGYPWCLICKYQMYNLIASLDCSKATGKNNIMYISARMLKGIPCTTQSNQVIHQNWHFSSNWKCARVIPLTYLKTTMGQFSREIHHCMHFGLHCTEALDMGREVFTVLKPYSAPPSAPQKVISY